MFYHQKVARVRVLADIQNFALHVHCVHGIPIVGRDSPHYDRVQRPISQYNYTYPILYGSTCGVGHDNQLNTPLIYLHIAHPCAFPAWCTHPRETHLTPPLGVCMLVWCPVNHKRKNIFAFSRHSLEAAMVSSVRSNVTSRVLGPIHIASLKQAHPSQREGTLYSPSDATEDAAWQQPCLQTEDCIPSLVHTQERHI